MSQYYKTNAIYEALGKVEHNFQWVSGNAWLLVYGNKSEQQAKILVLVHGTSWKIQAEIINTLNVLAKKLKIPVYKIVFDDSNDDSISEVAFSSSLKDEGEMYYLNELKTIFKNAGLDIIDGKCDKYLNDRASSAYHKWQRFSLGNKITVSDLDLIRVNNQSKEPIELIELKRSTAYVNIWKPYTDDYANFNLIDTISQQTSIPLSIVYNRMIKDRITKVISDDIHEPVSIFSFSNNSSQVLKREYSFDDFVNGLYLGAKNYPSPKKLICDICLSSISNGIYNYSISNYNGRVLCMSCQKKV